MLFLPFAGTTAPLAPLAGGSTGFLAAGGDLLLSDRDRDPVLSGLLVGGPLVTVLISTIQVLKLNTTNYIIVKTKVILSNDSVVYVLFD